MRVTRSHHSQLRFLAELAAYNVVRRGEVRHPPSPPSSPPLPSSPLLTFVNTVRPSHPLHLLHTRTHISSHTHTHTATHAHTCRHTYRHTRTHTTTTHAHAGAPSPHLHATLGLQTRPRVDQVGRERNYLLALFTPLTHTHTHTPSARPPPTSRTGIAPTHSFTLPWPPSPG